MAFKLKHQYLVAFIHSEGLARTFITTEGPLSGIEDVMNLDKRIERTCPEFSRVQVMSYQLVGTTV